LAFNTKLADQSGRLHYPKNWPSEFVSGDASRFAARYRVAKAARVDFDDGISEKVSEAYSAFTKLFLAFTAFEMFQKAFGITKPKDIQALDKKHGGHAIVQRIRAIHSRAPKFFNFIESMLDPGSMKKNLGKLTGGQDVCAVYLAKSFRHIFAHGILTPSANGSDPKISKEIGEILYQYLMDIMEAEAAALAGKVVFER
jgi:hypothetical protein